MFTTIYDNINVLQIQIRFILPDLNNNNESFYFLLRGEINMIVGN